MSGNQQALLMAGGGSGGGGGNVTPFCTADPYYGSGTVLTLHLDSFPPVDTSPSPKTVTVLGSAAISSVQSKFGTLSLYVPNTGVSAANGVQVTSTTDFNFGTGDFTIECWAYRLSNTYEGYLFYGVFGGELSVKVTTGGLITIQYVSSGGTQSAITAVSFPLNQWNFVVLQRRGSKWEFFLNGALSDIRNITGGATSTVNYTGDFFVGRTNSSSALAFNGYIDEFRVTKGYARYPNPNVPAAQFPDSSEDPFYSSVVVSIHANGANNSTTFVDSSSYARTLTANGNAKISTTNPKFGSGSAIFDGTTDYISAPSSTDLDFGTGDFTVEFWFKWATVTGFPYIVSHRGSGQGYYISVDSGTGALGFGRNGPVNDFRSIGGIPLDTTLWHHISVCRSGTSLYCYVDGQSTVAALTDTANYSTPNITSFGADTNGTNCLNGYLDDIRITKGVARYPISTPFTLPTLPGCDSTSAGGATPPVSERLTGASAAVVQGNVIDGSPFKRLVGTFAVASGGAVFPSVRIDNPTVALSGAGLTASRGSVAVQPYPRIVSRISFGSALEGVSSTGSLPTATVTFYPNGDLIVEITNTDNFVEPRQFRWINTTDDATGISASYQINSYTNSSGLAFTPSFGSYPATLDTVRVFTLVNNFTAPSVIISNPFFSVTRSNNHPGTPDPTDNGLYNFPVGLYRNLSQD